MTSIPHETTAQAVVDVLKRVEARIADPERWCRKAAALTKTGRMTEVTSRSAVRWCVYGAAIREIRDPDIMALAWDRHMARASRELYPAATPIGVNEALGHDAVMAVVRRAIELAEAEVTR